MLAVVLVLAVARQSVPRYQNAQLLELSDIADGAANDSMAIGCCVAFGFGEGQVQCCHVFTDELTSGACLDPTTPSIDFHLNKTCQDVRGLYENVASDSLSASPSPSVTASPSPSLSPVACHALNFCQPHGRCVDEACVCEKGYGRLSPDLVQDCSDYIQNQCEEACNGHGLCDPVSKSCECHPGYTGPTCATWTRCQSLSYCSGNGVCSPSGQAEICICESGWTGSDCSLREIVTCPAHCSGHGSCESAGPPQNIHTCRCQSGYSGDGCQDWSGPNCPHHCGGLGQCTSTGNCSCSTASGAYSTDCSFVVNTCPGCRHGLCRAGVCECLKGYEGRTCSKYNQSLEVDCAKLHFCHGRGVCVRPGLAGGESSCTCFEGFAGSDCSLIDKAITDHCPNYCSGHGTCRMTNEPHCVCGTGWTGPGCDISACPSHGGRQCGGRGICEKKMAVVKNVTVHTFRCHCADGWAGNTCSESLCPRSCSGHGRCTAARVCVCDSSYGGEDCATDLTHYISPSGDIVTGIRITPVAPVVNESEQKTLSRSGNQEDHSVTTTVPAAGLDDTNIRPATHETQPNQPTSQGKTTQTQGTGGGASDIRTHQLPSTIAEPAQFDASGVAYASDEGGGPTISPSLLRPTTVRSGCPNDCSGRGDCVDDLCSCFEGFAGDDCSVGLIDPINSLEDIIGD